MANGVRITWDIGLYSPEKHHIYRSESPIDPNNLPAPIGEVGEGINEYIDLNATLDQHYWYIVAADKKGLIIPAMSAVDIVPLLIGPGGNTFIGGDTNAGFAGEVPVSELFTGTELASAIGLAAGTTQYSNEPWLKFVLDGEILYVAKKPYRNTLSWNDINAVNTVYNNEGSQVVSKDGYDFRVTLLTGANEDPSSAIDGNNPEGTELSEWNRLMYKVHVDDPSGEPWANYTNADIGIGTGNGRLSWCQETDANDSTQRVRRGNSSLLEFGRASSSNANIIFGWRPALRLIR